MAYLFGIFETNKKNLTKLVQWTEGVFHKDICGEYPTLHAYGFGINCDLLGMWATCRIQKAPVVLGGDFNGKF